MTAPDYRALTAEYVAAFDACDLDAVSALMADTFSLTDPSVRDLSPRSAVLDYIAGIFSSVENNVNFTARSILADGDRTVIEFDLSVGETRLEGTDVIEWTEDGKMQTMRAYLTELT